MKPLLVLSVLVITLTALTTAQTVVQRDNGVFAGAYTNLGPYTEESCILAPEGPCDVVGLQVYLGGGAGTIDIIIAADPSEGLVPPTNWCWSYAAYGQVSINHTGTAQWYNIDIASLGLKSDGYDRFVIQHRSIPSGPRFGLDNQGQSAPNNSFLMDPNSNNGLGLPGAMYTTGAHYMVRLLVNYHFPSGPGSAGPPAATMVEASRNVGLVGPQNDRYSATRVSVADWNNDGWDDVTMGPHFFQNNGNGTFSNKTYDFNILMNGTVWGDIDNDGHLDMYCVEPAGGDKLYRNNGNGTFTDITSSSNIANPYPTVQPIWLDYNNDGLLDLFIANGSRTVNNQAVFYQDKLWRNDGNNMFTDVTTASGIAATEPSPFFDCWGASAIDYNRDGFVDIFVATYQLAPDILYRNNGDGTFTNVATSTGVLGEATQNPNYFGHGIGNAWGDVNNDGYIDLAIGNLGHPDYRGQFSNPSLLYMNDGPMNFIFREKRKEKGLKFFELNAGTTFLDLDLDGNLDLWQSQYSYRAVGNNGEPKRISRMYMNSGPPGYTFKDRTWHLGPVIHGAWTAVRLDFNKDGAPDLLVASPSDSTKLFRNDVTRNGSFLAIRLKGAPASNVPLDGYGAEVRVLLTNGKRFTQQLAAGGGGTAVSQNSSELLFGLGQNATIDKVTIVWPGLQVKNYTGLNINERYTLHFDGTITPVEFTSFTGVVVGDDVLLEWQTANETNNMGFEVQKSFDGKRFEAIGFIQGAGTSLEPHAYSFTDRLDATAWYRLRQVDFDGTFAYSSTLTFEPFGATQFMLAANYPNPFRQSTNIRYAVIEETNVSITVYDALGRYVRTLANATQSPGNFHTAWDGADDKGYPMPAGMYVYKMQAGGYFSAKTMHLNR